MLLHFIDSSILFNGYSSPVLNTHYGYDTSFVSKVEGAKDAATVRQIIREDLQVVPEHLTEGCVEIVQWACQMVARRAAALAACAIAAVILHTGTDRAAEGQEDKGVDVGLDGRWEPTRYVAVRLSLLTAMSASPNSFPILRHVSERHSA